MLALVAVAVAAMWAISAYFSSRHAEDFARIVAEQSLLRTRDRVETLLRQTIEGTETAFLLTPTDSPPTAADFERIFGYLAQSFRAHEEMSYLGIGLEATGEYCMVQRLPDGGVGVRAYYRKAGGAMEIWDYRPVGDALQRDRVQASDGYDPRKRPFYQFARRAGTNAWTDTYSFWPNNQKGPSTGISFVMPVYGPGRELFGVWDGDLDTAQLSTFLRTLSNELPGVAFIVEHADGGENRIVAHPRMGGALSPRDDETMSAAAAFGAAAGGGAGADESMRRFFHRGQAFFAQTARLQGPDRPRWTLCVLVPEAETRRYGTERGVLFLVATGLVAALAALAAALVARRVAEPLAVLQAQTEAVASGADRRELVLNGPREVQQVGAAFNAMADRVRRQRRELVAVNEGLRHEATLRDAALADLRQSEERFSRAFHSSPTAMCITRQRDALYLDVNDAWLAATGYELAGLIGRSKLDTGFYASVAERDALLNSLERDGVVQGMAMKIRRASGEVREVLLSAQAIQLNREDCLILSLIDVTKERRHEAELAAARERMEVIFETSPAAKIVTRRRDGFIVAVNEAFCGLVGRPKESMRGRTTLEAGLWPSDEARNARLREVLTGPGSLRNHETHFVLPDGRLRTVSASVEAVVIDGDDCLLFVFLDITERRVAEEALRANETRLRRLNEISLGLGLEGAVRRTRDETFHQLTRTAVEALGLASASLWRYQRIEGRFECLDRFDRGAGVHSSGEILLARDYPSFFLALGNDRTLAVREAPTEWRTRELGPWLAARGSVSLLTASARHAGELTGLLLLEHAGTPREWTRDEELFAAGLADLFTLTVISVEREVAREQLQAVNSTLEQRVARRTTELQSANEKLKELDRLKSEFVAMMSHELRTPLNSIIGFTGIVKGGLAGPVNPEQKRQLEMVYGSARHLLSLINDILDLSRIEAGRVELDLSSFDPCEVVRDAERTLAPMVAVKGLTLTVEAPAEPLRIYSDRKRVFQIVLNLANNAVKFTERGRVTLSIRQEQERCIVCVSDTGPGMSQEALGNLFQAFRQVDGTARRVYEGTGLGLYLCRKLLDLLGGQISVTTELGRGSSFTFWLPLHGPQTDPHP
jgi:PAS domain S-box-containing protein